MGPGGLPAVCAAADTPIATPQGERPISSIRVGDLVYTMDHGAILPVPVARAEHVDVHAHRVVRVQLQNGRVLRISPGHPTSDGIDIATLTPGDQIGGQTVASTALVPYEQPATYDILPLSDSGAYFAAGVPLGSTLARARGCLRRAPADEPLRH